MSTENRVSDDVFGDNKPSTDIAIATKGMDIVRSLCLLQRSLDGVPVCNIMTGKGVPSHVLYRLSMPCADKTNECVGRTIDLVGFSVTPRQRDDKEKGEIESYLQIALLLSDGSVIGSGSKGILDSLIGLSYYHGPGPWMPPLRCIVRGHKVGKPSPLLYLEWIGPQDGE